MRPHIPPKPIEPYLTSCSPRSRNLKDPVRNSQRRICCHHLHARYPLCQLSSLRRRDIALQAVVDVDVAHLFASNVGESFGGANVSEEGAVALENVGFVGTAGNWMRGVGPWASVFGGVIGAEG